MVEFGLSNGLKIKDGTPNYQNQALWELLHYLYPYTHGYCGSMKWLLNDWTKPYIDRYAKWWTDPAATAYEQQFGIFAFDGTATGVEKPVAWCLKFFADYLAAAPKPGTLGVFETQNQVQAGFEYRAEDAWFYGGEAFASQAIRWDNPETKVVMARWDAGAITLLSTIDMDLELNPKALVATPLPGASPQGTGGRSPC